MGPVSLSARLHLTGFLSQGVSLLFYMPTMVSRIHVYIVSALEREKFLVGRNT